MFYVYQLKYYDDVLYIGCGFGNRLDHLLSCTSHNSYLNRFASLGYIEEHISITKLQENIPDKKEALKIESKFIKELKPLFNKTKEHDYYEYFAGKSHKVEYYLEQHKFNRMFDVLKWGKSAPYIDSFKEQIKKLEDRLSEVIDQNDRLLKIVKKGVY